MIGEIFLGGDKQALEISVMDNDVPLLIWMDILGPECTSALIDCGNGYLMLPKLSNNIYQCKRLGSGHLAINVTTPQWWETISPGVAALTNVCEMKALTNGGEPGRDDAKTLSCEEAAAGR